MISISVSYATPEKQVEISVNVEANCTVAMAIRRSGILKQFPEIDFASIRCGIYSRKVNLDDIVCQDDRVEIYRPLIIDPKAARKQRAKKA